MGERGQGSRQGKRGAVVWPHGARHRGKASAAGTSGTGAVWPDTALTCTAARGAPGRLETTWDWQSELWTPHNIRTSWDDSDSFIPGGFIEGETVADGGWWGLWSGNFFGNGPAGPAGHPASFAGTFGATDGTRSIAGSYGVHKQSTLTAGQHVTPSLSLIWEE